MLGEKQDFTITGVIGMTFNEEGILIKHLEETTGEIHYVLIKARRQYL